MWLAREIRGALYLHYEKPVKVGNLYWKSSGDRVPIDFRLFKNVHFDDAEPTEIVVKLKIKTICG